MLIRRFPTQHDRFYKFSRLLVLQHAPGELDEYIMTFLDLQAQIPGMSALDTLEIYLGRLEHTVRINSLDTQHAGTLECALEESRKFAETHWGHDISDDPMDLTVPTSLARPAEFLRPPERSHSSSARCSNCGLTGLLRSTCCVLPRSSLARHRSLNFVQHVSRLPR